MTATGNVVLNLPPNCVDLFDLSDADFELLYEACALHTDGLTRGRHHDPELLGRGPPRFGPRGHHA